MNIADKLIKDLLNRKRYNCTMDNGNCPFNNEECCDCKESVKGEE